MGASRDHVRIFLRDCAAQLRVGIEPHEKRAPQTVIVNVECEAAGAPRFDDPAEENLTRAVDYAAIYRFITEELAAMPHIPLLESAAEIIASFCLRDARVASVRVRLEKPNILPGAAGAGVEIRRTRSGA
jgi:dihydroneopterin aldolase